VLLDERCLVFTANGGIEALAVLATETVDVVLSDVVMPDMDGYDLYMELKERLPQTPVVLMTAYYYDKDHVIKRSRLEGLDQVIFKKPIDPKRLKAILEQVSKRDGRYGVIGEVTPEEAAAVLKAKKDAVYVDVRSEAEFEAGHPQGSYNIPVFFFDADHRPVPNPKFAEIVEATFAKDKPLLLGCQSGMRSAHSGGDSPPHVDSPTSRT